jgi:protocatechuate 3,4-dioxygenase beta subunit
MPAPRRTRTVRGAPIFLWAIGLAIVALIATLVWTQSRAAESRPRANGNHATTTTGSARANAAVRSRLAGHVIAVGSEAPVPHAIIAVRSVASARGVVHVTADAQGEFSIDVLSGTYEVRATAAGRVQRRPERVVVQGEAVVTLRLHETAGGAHGRVLDAESGSLVGALVVAHSVARPAEAPSSAVSGDDGTYRLALPDGDYLVTATFEGYVDHERRIAIRGGLRALDFHLYAGATVRGRVVADANGAPIRGACVRGAADDDFAGLVPEHPRACAITDDDGAYELTGLRPGRVALTASAPAMGVDSPRVISVSLGAAIDGVELRLVAAHDVRGIVATLDGTAVPEIAVVALRPDDAGRTAARAVTDEQGRFVLPGLSPGGYLVRTEPDPRALVSAVKQVDVPAAAEVALVVERGVTVSGRVVPAGAGTVRVRAVQDGVAISAIGTALTAETALEGAISEAGTFRLDGVPPGRWQIVAETGAGSGAARVDAAANDVSDVVIELGALAELCGRALDQHDTPLANVTVTAMVQSLPSSPAAGLFRHARHELARDGVATDEHGDFCLRSLEAGTYLIVVRDENLALMWTQRHIEGGNLVPVTLAAGERRAGWSVHVHRQRALIAGRVLDAAGRGVADALVSVERSQAITGDAAIQAPVLSSFTPPLPTITGPTGAFEIEVPDGLRYRVHVEHAATERRGERDDVAPGTPVTIRLAPNGRLRCTAPGDRGVCRVRLQGPIAAEATGAGTSCEVSFAQVPAGTYTVEARRGDSIGTARVTVAPESEATCVVNLMSRVAVTARVVDTDGRALEGLPALLVDESSADQLATLLLGGAAVRTGADGRVTWRVVPGAATLAILSRDGQRLLHTRAVSVTAPSLNLGDIAVTP